MSCQKIRCKPGHFELLLSTVHRPSNVAVTLTQETQLQLMS